MKSSSPRYVKRQRFEPALVNDYALTREDAEVAVALGALLHCIGMSVHRERHRYLMSIAPPFISLHNSPPAPCSMSSVCAPTNSTLIGYHSRNVTVETTAAPSTGLA